MFQRGNWWRRFINLFSETNPKTFRRLPLKTRSHRLLLEPLEERRLLSTLDITTKVLSYTPTAGVNNNIAISVAAGNYSISDTAEIIQLTGDAAATWTLSVDKHTAMGSDTTFTS